MASAAYDGEGIPLTPEEIARLRARLARERRQEIEAAARNHHSFLSFLAKAGLEIIADKLAPVAWEHVKRLIKLHFGIW